MEVLLSWLDKTPVLLSILDLLVSSANAIRKGVTGLLTISRKHTLRKIGSSYTPVSMRKSTSNQPLLKRKVHYCAQRFQLI